MTIDRDVSDWYQNTILGNLDALVYVSDIDTLRVLFANEYAKRQLGVYEGQSCSEGIYGCESACDSCNSQDLFDINGKPLGMVRSERYNPKDNRWYDCRTRAVPWTDGRMVRLEVAVDITDHVILREQASHQDEYYHTVLNSIGDAVIVTDGEGLVTWMNPVAQVFTGWKRDHAIGHPLKEVFHIVNTHTRKRCEDPVAKVLKSGGIVGLANHTSLLARDGIEYQIADSAAPVVDRAGVVHGVILVFHDVTEEYARREELRRSEEQFRGLFENSINAIALHEIVCDQDQTPIDYRFLAVNRAFELMTGLKSADLIGKRVLEILPDTEPSWIEKYGRVAQTGVPLDFEDYSQEVEKYFSVRAYKAGVNQFVAVFYDITERKQMEAKLNKLVFLDSLTGLYNRRFFEQELQKLDTASSLPLSLIMGDVNGLKIINDSMGHQQGDQVLTSIAKVLAKVCRPTDIVARWGGDEFVILLPNTNPEKVHDICVELEEASAKAGDTEYALSLGLGYATKSSLNEKIEDILRRAENRMYQHKMSNANSSRSALVASLQRTLAEKSHETEEHARHLQRLATELGRRIGLSDSEIDKTSLVALLHDIGKVAISESILDKPGPLSEDEWEIMQKHCEIGYRIVVSSPDLIEVADGILSHHERWDGSGYPRRLKGTQIPLSARIVALVDAFDAMTTDRAYRKRRSQAEALAEIESQVNRQFQSDVTYEFIRMIKEMSLEGDSIEM